MTIETFEISWLIVDDFDPFFTSLGKLEKKVRLDHSFAVAFFWWAQLRNIQPCFHKF